MKRGSVQMCLTANVESIENPLLQAILRDGMWNVRHNRAGP